jgi:hypothetical protein
MKAFAFTVWDKKIFKNFLHYLLIRTIHPIPLQHKKFWRMERPRAFKITETMPYCIAIAKTRAKGDLE